MVELSLPLFVTPADVILRMQLDGSLTGIQDVVSSGIMGAELHVQRMLDSDLKRMSHDCMYFLDGDAFSGIQPGGVFRLEVPSGFVRRDTAVTLTVSAAVSVGTVGTPFTTFTAIEAGYSRVDYDRGYVYIDATKYANCYVRVQCDTGFEDGTTPDGESPPGFIPMEQIPMPVYEAIMGLVPLVMNSQQTTNRSNEATEQYKTLVDHATLLLQPYVRVKGFSFRPIWKS